MAIFGKRRARDDAPADGAPRTLLDETSPYGSRRVLVATNGTETWAQLFDGSGGQVTALWLAAHRGPTPDVQLSVPPETTRNPSGRPHFDRVEAVWFEEGDGVALFDADGMLAVLPGWAGPETLPGYAREAVAPSPSAAPLQSAIEQFGPRAERARGYWAWRARQEAWQEYQQDVAQHVATRLGQAQQVWPLGQGNPPVVAGRHGTENEHVAVTVGMSAQRMPAVEQYVDEPGPYSRIELAVAGLGRGDVDLVLLRWLARHPWRAATWIGSRHTVRWPGTGFPVGEPFAGVLLLDEPTLLPGPAAPDLGGHNIFGDPVRFLWLVPVTEEEITTARAEGVDALLAQLRAAGRTWVAGDAGKPATPPADPALGEADDDLADDEEAAAGPDADDEDAASGPDADDDTDADADAIVDAVAGNDDEVEDTAKQATPKAADDEPAPDADAPMEAQDSNRADD
ncbi:MAG: suppressor of fused domain protein [Streptosporangiales bacterium]|nr:suppressor of fused domain protein [Streptosporangiales bacterium]